MPVRTSHSGNARLFPLQRTWLKVNWWTNGVKPDGQRKWEGVPQDAFAASGHNNNDLFIIPSWGMVVVRLGLDEGGQGGFEISDATHAAFLRRLGETLVK
jgi:hypothetical protein